MYNRHWGNDRRRFQRLNLNLVVWYKALDPEYVRNMLGSSDREAITLDISPFGMAFKSSFNIPAFSNLALKFIVFNSHDNPDSSLAMPVEVSARVRSCVPFEGREYRVGVSFGDMEPEKQQKLAHFVRQSLRPCL